MQPFRIFLMSVWLFAATATPGAQSGTDRMALLGRLIHDESPKVRLEALRALAHIPTAEAAALALSVLELPMDPTLDYALWLTINDLAEPWIQAIQSGAWKPEGREKQLEFALRALKPDQASRVLTQALASRPLDADGTGPWIELIGAAGSPRELRSLYDRVLQSSLKPEAAVRALRALTEAARLRKVRPEGDLTGFQTLLESAAPPIQIAALRLAAVWKPGGNLLAVIRRIAGAATTTAEARSAALEALRAHGGRPAIESLRSLAAEGATPDARREALVALAALDLGEATPAIVATLQTSMDEASSLAFWRALLGIKGAGKSLAEALPASGLDPTAARAGVRVAREGGRHELELIVALARGAGLSTDTATASAELVREMAARAAAAGDPRRGEWVYRRADLACTVCHAIGGAGGRVGPDMTSIGASAPIDYLAEALLLPHAKIKEGYHSVVVSTKDGSEFTGTLARETPQEIVLYDATGAERSIAKTDVERREHGTLSLMPSGLLDALDTQEQLDLVAFLSQLGKPGDFDASQGGIARRWWLAQTFHTDAQAGQDLWPIHAPLNDKRWQPTLALVRGTLSAQLIAQVLKAEFWSARLGVYAATEIEVANPGNVRLTLDAGPGAELWIDGRRAGPAGDLTVALDAGRHRAVVRLEPKQMPDTVRLRSPDAAFVLR